MSGGAIVENGFTWEEETHLTVLKTSRFFAGDGFTAYDSKGELVFRVDSYGTDISDRGELVLMDGSGRCLLTVRRKRPSLHQRWEGYLGERADGQKPIFSVRRSSIIGRSDVTVEIYGGGSPGEEYQIEGLFANRCCPIYDAAKEPVSPGKEYQIEGSFANRCCTIYDAAKEPVAEIRRKVDASAHVVLGKDVFSLFLKPEFDGAFAMGLVLILDQINGDGDGDDDDDGVGDGLLNEDSHLSS